MVTSDFTVLSGASQFRLDTRYGIHAGTRFQLLIFTVLLIDFCDAGSGFLHNICFVETSMLLREMPSISNTHPSRVILSR